MAIEQSEKYITSEEAKEAYDYIPEDIDLPKLGANDEGKLEDIPLRVKLFLPETGWTWYIIEGDRETDYYFAYVVSGIDPNFSEFGYITMKQLKEMRSPTLRLPVERDIHWNPKSFKEEGLEL